jgi:hypothetical protein
MRSGIDFKMGSIWDRFGIDLGSIWDRFGIDLGSIWDRFSIRDLTQAIMGLMFSWDRL